jgi:hypothetical protein
VKNIRVSSALAPATAIASASATILCCLPWGIGAALGSFGLSMFFARHHAWFLSLSIVLLCLGILQVELSKRSCQRRSRTEIAILSIAAAIVFAIAVFPQWVAGLLVGQLP